MAKDGAECGNSATVNIIVNCAVATITNFNPSYKELLHICLGYLFHSVTNCYIFLDLLKILWNIT